MKKSKIIIALLLGVSWMCANSQNPGDKYAIQNIKSGKNLRPYEAISGDGNKIVLYDHVEWKCMTWEFKKTGENTFQLKNLFTSKTFQPSENNIQPGTGLEQQGLINGDNRQLWEFNEITKGIFNIRLKGTELFITQSDVNGKTNSPIVLNKLDNSESQKWKLIKQDPKF